MRRIGFAIWLYGLTALMAILAAPCLLLPRAVSMAVVRLWAGVIQFGLRHIAGVRVEVRGRQHLPHGAALVAAKHMGMLDTVAPFVFLPDPAFVLKKELLKVPLYGWFCLRSGMIPLDRAGHAKALKQLVEDSRSRLKDHRQIVIFPEGTRKTVGETADYKPGVAALYRELAIPCTPMATNSGLFWPAHGIGFNPGIAVFEFLEPIPAGLKRGEFMRTLEERIETASARLAMEESTRPS